MPQDHLETLWNSLPFVFDLKDLPDEWDAGWHIIPINTPDEFRIATEADDNSPPERWIEGLDPAPRAGESAIVWNEKAHQFPNEVYGDFPGSLMRREIGAPPPPDAIAFYLPFHYFYPSWWGIYLIAESVIEVAEFLVRAADGVLTPQEAIQVARIFAFAHEQYHHAVESFGTRLEITHRRPLYKAGFHRFFRDGLQRNDCLEEALATAYGIDRVFDAVKQANKKLGALKALRAYVAECPVVYRQGASLIRGMFNPKQNEFAEALHHISLMIEGANPELWGTFSHAFHPFRRVNSRVNYLVHRGSPLAGRLPLQLRYLRYREMINKLKELTGCELVRAGKGSHEIWRTKDGKTFPVPHHAGDLPRGTLAKIIKQAGLQMSLDEFAHA